jgi:hypothetical protein
VPGCRSGLTTHTLLSALDIAALITAMVTP